MKKIKLQSINVNNFKGIQKQEFDFDFENETTIQGDNGTGKTSIFDAFTWLLFGKDSAGRKDFNVKNLNLIRTEASVCAMFIIDGQEIELKRVFREKWQKKRGETTEEFVGNETFCFYNDVPFQIGEFQKKISETFCDEQLFKLITNPHEFMNLAWSERRSILFKAVGEQTEQELFEAFKQGKTNACLQYIQQVINEKKTLEESKREISAKKKKIKDELVLIPSRIDEANRAKPSGKIDINVALSNLKANTNELLSIEETILSEQKQFESLLEGKKGFQNRIAEISLEINKIALDENSVYQNNLNEWKEQLNKEQAKQNENENKLRFYRKEVEIAEAKIKTSKLRETESEATLAELRAKFIAKSAETFSFDSENCTCPTCKQSLPDQDKQAQEDTLRAEFNRNKISFLESNKKIGIEEAGQLQIIREAIKIEETSLADLNKKIETTTDECLNQKTTIEILTDSKPFENDFTVDEARTIELKAEIASLEKQIKQAPSFDASKYTSRIAFLKSENEVAQKQIIENEAFKNQEKRVQELLAEETTLASALNEIESFEFFILEFESFKINKLEEKINANFETISFRMFKQQINGAMEPGCEAMIAGVPYSDANNAAQINAGLEVINFLLKINQVSAPVFIDNSESITKFINFDFQIIKLEVCESAKELTIKLN